MTDGPSSLTAGDRLALRGGEWLLAETTAWPDCTTLRVAPRHRVFSNARTFVYPADRPRRISADRRFAIVRRRRWLHAVRRIGAGLAPFGALGTASRHDIELLPHQVEPALAMLRHGATRVLIADDVGLGKTIQAGLVLAELQARRMEFRALVLVPAGLRNQWCGELAARFRLQPLLADSDWLRRAALNRPPGVNPWSVPGVYVASFDFVKRPEVLRPLEDTTWDLVIVDEAHAASAGTDRRTAAHAIAQRAARVLLLTATPHAGNEGAFQTLCRLGELGPGPPIVLFRRSHSAIRSSMPRRTLFLPVHLTELELRMHSQLESYTRRVWRESIDREDRRGCLASIVLRKRALSSAASLAASIQRRIQLLAGAPPLAAQLSLPLEDECTPDDSEMDAVLGAGGLADARLEHEWLEEIRLTSLRAALAESKLARLVRLLARTRETAIVFTEYRDTLVRIAAALGGAGREPLLMHGGLSQAERARVLREFHERGTTLLATDAASEGLNLHTRCRLVVHFELPWSAARLAQRAGRVDRFGQTRRVHEIALVAASTAERIVLGPLLRRAVRARARDPGTPEVLDLLTESRVAEVVLGDASAAIPAPATLTDPEAGASVLRLEDEAVAEVRRSVEVRTWIERSGDAPPPASVSCTTIGSAVRGWLPPGMVLLYVVEVVDREGHVTHREPLVLSTHQRPTAVKSANALRQWLEITLPEIPGVQAHLRSAERRALQEVAGLQTAARRGVSGRLEAQRAILSLASVELVQASLFDRRALCAAAARRRARLEQAEALAAAAGSAGPPDLRCRSALAAVLVVPGARRS